MSVRPGQSLLNTINRFCRKPLTMTSSAPMFLENSGRSRGTSLASAREVAKIAYRTSRQPTVKAFTKVKLMIRPIDDGLRHAAAWLACLAILWLAATAPAQEPSPTVPGEPAPSVAAGAATPMIEFLFKTPTGWVLIAAYLFFVGLMVWLIIDMRGSNFMPADYVEKLDEQLRAKQFKEAFELSKDESSPFGKVMTAGMARLSTGLQEARDAAEFMLESAKARKDALIGYMAVLGTLGPLIGLVGTVSGMIDTFSELGRGTTPNVGKLASGISHALNATLVGIFLSVLDASLLADDFLTQSYYSARKTDSSPSTVSGTQTAVQARPVAPPTKPDGK